MSRPRLSSVTAGTPPVNHGGIMNRELHSFRIPWPLFVAIVGNVLLGLLATCAGAHERGQSPEPNVAMTCTLVSTGRGIDIQFEPTQQSFSVLNPYLIPSQFIDGVIVFRSVSQDIELTWPAQHVENRLPRIQVNRREIVGRRLYVREGERPEAFTEGVTLPAGTYTIQAFFGPQFLTPGANREYSPALLARIADKQTVRSSLLQCQVPVARHDSTQPDATDGRQLNVRQRGRWSVLQSSPGKGGCDLQLIASRIQRSERNYIDYSWWLANTGESYRSIAIPAAKWTADVEFFSIGVFSPQKSYAGDLLQGRSWAPRSLRPVDWKRVPRLGIHGYSEVAPVPGKLSDVDTGWWIQVFQFNTSELPYVLYKTEMEQRGRVTAEKIISWSNAVQLE